MTRRGRREFLIGLVAVGAGGLARPSSGGASRLRVGVVGGGIVGASIALHLARAGARVMLFEKIAPGRGATQNSFAWVNAFVDDPHYRTLRIQSLLAYRELDKTMSLNMVWGGYLDWGGNAAESDIVRSNARQLVDTPYPVRAITVDEFARLDPNVAPGPVTDAFYSSIDGHLDPVFVTRQFIDYATRAGGKALFPCEVTGLDVRAGRLRGIATTQGTFALDRLVIAGGVDTPHLLAMAGFSLALKHAPGILAHSISLPPLTRVVHDAPGDVSFKQMADGSVVGTDAPTPPDIPAHHGIRTGVEDFPTQELREYHGRRILARIGRFLPGAQGAALVRLTLGFRPMPLDEFPVLGAIPGLSDLYVAVTHSGVTLAPIIGRLAAKEVLDASRAEMFAPYRPERFLGA